MRESSHSYYILGALLLALVWVNSPYLANFSLQLTAGLVVFLVAGSKIFPPEIFLLTESIVSTICVVLITTATGGFNSPFFFLNHFLLFELSLLLAPIASITTSIGLMVFYIYANQTASSLINLGILVSFVFMTPLAFIMGKIYREKLRGFTLKPV